MNNMNIPLIIFIFSAIHTILTDSTSLNTDYYYAGMIITFILACITFYPSNVTYIIGTTIILALIGGFIEHNLFPENYSWKKIIARTICAISLFLSKDVLRHVVDYDLIWLGIGYFGMSVGNMLYIIQGKV